MLQKGFSIVGLLKAARKTEAKGRLGEREPVGVIDIGSNSIRLVLFEGITRSPSILFNEKIMAGLGKSVAKDGRLDEEAVDRALSAIRRYAQLAKQSRVSDLHVLATAASRDAENGPEFIKAVTDICKTEVKVLTGEEEARFARLGVITGFFSPDGIVGDLGGGSLELSPVISEPAAGLTTPLGGLRLANDADGNVSRARKIAKKELKAAKVEWPGKGRTFYAVGGTWRALAKLHMFETEYPLEVVHEYTIPAEGLREFCEKIMKTDLAEYPGSDVISSNRIDLIPYAAAVLGEVISILNVDKVSFSATGLRDGFMYSLLDMEDRDQDALLEATAEIALLRSRSPKHCVELGYWTQAAFEALGWKESKEVERYRIAACNLADIAWRTAMDYRAEQTLGIINNAGFTALAHEGRAYLAIVNFHRYQGLGSKKVPPVIAKLADDDLTKHARTLAAFFRVLYLFSASVEGVLPKIKFIRDADGMLVFQVPRKLEQLAGERPRGRIDQLAKEIGEDIVVEIV